MEQSKRKHYIEEEEDEEYDYGIYNNQQLFNAGYGEGGMCLWVRVWVGYGLIGGF